MIHYAHLTSVLSRFQEAGGPMKIGALFGIIVQLVVPDAFFWLFLILVGSNVADWIYGRHAARARGEFSATKSRNGITGKAAQITILLVLRSLEAVLPLTGIPSTLGIGSAAVALALIVEDLESLERHVITLGGKRIPALSPVLRRIRELTGGDRRHPDHPLPPSGQGMRRRDKDPGPEAPPHDAPLADP